MGGATGATYLLCTLKCSIYLLPVGSIQESILGFGDSLYSTWWGPLAVILLCESVSMLVRAYQLRKRRVYVWGEKRREVAFCGEIIGSLEVSGVLITPTHRSCFIVIVR